MSGISGIGSAPALPDNKAASGAASGSASKGGDTTSTTTNADGSTTTTVTGPTGAVISVSTVTAQGDASGPAPGGTESMGPGSPGSAGLLNIRA